MEQAGEDLQQPAVEKRALHFLQGAMDVAKGLPFLFSFLDLKLTLPVENLDILQKKIKMIITKIDFQTVK